MILKNNSIAFPVFVVAIILCFNFTKSHAQNELDLRLQSKPIGVVYQKDRKYKGSEFWFEKWNTGEIYLTNGQKIDNLQLNFNAYSNNLNYTINGKPVVVSKAQIVGFKILGEEKEYEFELIADTSININQDEPVYFELLYNGANKAYAYRKFKVNETLVKNNPFGKSVFYSDIKYYVTIHNNLINSPLSKKSYYSYYGKIEVKNIIRSNSLNLKEESDLVKFIELLNNLEINSIEP